MESLLVLLKILFDYAPGWAVAAQFFFFFGLDGPWRPMNNFFFHVFPGFRCAMASHKDAMAYSCLLIFEIPIQHFLFLIFKFFVFL